MKNKIKTYLFFTMLLMTGESKAMLKAESPCADLATPIGGLNFSPYPSAQHPGRNPYIRPEQIAQRLTLIEDCTRHIRTFSVRWGMDRVVDMAMLQGIQVTPGAWLGKDHISNLEAIDTLTATMLRNKVPRAIIGSEALLRHDLDAKQLGEYLRYARGKLGNYGEIGYADTHDQLKANQPLLEDMDVIYANFYPYWEGISIEASIAFLDSAYRELQARAPGKPIIISETGWPSCGRKIGKAIASPENSARYFREFTTWATKNNVEYFYFSAFDASWKTEYEGPQGGCWGLIDENGNAKTPLSRHIPPSIRFTPCDSRPTT